MSQRRQRLLLAQTELMLDRVDTISRALVTRAVPLLLILTALTLALSIMSSTIKSWHEVHRAWPRRRKPSFILLHVVFIITTFLMLLSILTMLTLVAHTFDRRVHEQVDQTQHIISTTLAFALIVLGTIFTTYELLSFCIVIACFAFYEYSMLLEIARSMFHNRRSQRRSDTMHAAGAYAEQV